MGLKTLDFNKEVLSGMEDKTVFEKAMRILELGGIEENFSIRGVRCIVKSYEDSWGGGFVIRYGGVAESERKKLEIFSEFGEKCLFSADIVGDDITVNKFDRTTMWDLYLSACLDEAEDNAKSSDNT